MFEINMAMYAEGKEAYRNGNTLADVFARMKIEHDAANDNREWREHQTAANSFALGFMDGALDDIRATARGIKPSGLRA